MRLTSMTSGELGRAKRSKFLCLRRCVPASYPRQSDGQWPCPNLKILDLRSVQGLVEEDIADFEAGRWGVGGDGTQEGQHLPQRPRRLENFRLPSTLGILRDAEDMEDAVSDAE